MSPKRKVLGDGSHSALNRRNGNLGDPRRGKSDLSAAAARRLEAKVKSKDSGKKYSATTEAVWKAGGKTKNAVSNVLSKLNDGPKYGPKGGDGKDKGSFKAGGSDETRRKAAAQLAGMKPPNRRKR